MVAGGLLFAGSVAGAVASMPGAAAPEVSGRLPTGVKEASGLAVSRLEAGIWWTHDDSGGQPVLQAMTTDGTASGAVRVAGVKNVDWEDMASFTLEGRAWLLVADVGDNSSGRRNCRLHVIEEPAPAERRAAAERGEAVAARVAWTIPVVYPDGPRDCEAVAVDAVAERVYLLAKRTKPHGLYVLPLRPMAESAGEARPGAPIAERAGEMVAFPGAEGPAAFLPTPAGMYRGQPTGMDFAADGTAAVVLTYGDVLVYPKTKDETWAEALARPGRVLVPHGLAQAEAVAFGATGEKGATKILVTSEGAGAEIKRYGREN